MTAWLLKKKPIEVMAIQWDGTNGEEIEEFIGDPRRQAFHVHVFPVPAQLYVAKTGSWVKLPTGDWVVKEPDGSGVYPVADEMIKQTFEVIKELPDALPGITVP